ncbi:MAG: SBBP repeat-containing protein [Gemmataceae bacterium]|nr:SBBP repeat-containing protein [Gemmataceae bacterium]
MSWLSSLRSWFRHRLKGRTERSRQRRSGSRLAVESLEDRRVPAGPVPSTLGVVLPDFSSWFLRHTAGPGAPTTTPFNFGGVGWTPIAGDWDGNGTGTLGTFDPSTATFYLRNTNTPGFADAGIVHYGAPGWIPVAGDWDGDGKASIGVFDPNTATWYLKNSNTPGAPDFAPFAFGAPGWLPVVGDWDGDGRTTIGVYDPNAATFYLSSRNGPGLPDAGVIHYGATGWLPVAGDWNGDGTDTIGVFDPNFATWYLRNSNSPGAPDIAPFNYGGVGWKPVVLPQEPAYQTALNAVRFEANQGQTDAQALFLTRARGYNSVFTPEGVVISPGTASLLAQDTSADTTFDETLTATQPGSTAIVDPRLQRLLFAGANPGAPVSGGQQLVTRTNYLFGNDPSAWLTDVPNFGEVRYQGIYSGVDAVFRDRRGQVEYAFEVAAGSDPGAIALAFPDSSSLNINELGQLLVGLPDGSTLLSTRPVFYEQTPAGVRDLEGRYVLRGGSQVGFEVVGHDFSRPLVIDPVLYATYLGGTPNEEARGVAVDDTGSAYATGLASGTSFPTTPTSLQPAFGGGANDVFVTKFDNAGTALLYSTFIGGTGADEGNAIAVDPGGNAYVTGKTVSANFPTSPGAFRTTSAGADEAFVLKLNPAGNGLVYSTLLGGNGNDQGTAIAVQNGLAFVTGRAASTNFPTTPGVVQPSTAFQNSCFVTKVNADGTGLVYSTYICGTTNLNEAAGIAVDAGGNAYVTGRTNNFGDFPLTPGAFQTTFTSGSEAYVLKLNPLGTAYIYGTLLGSGGDDSGLGIAVDANGSAYVTGFALGNSFPTTPGAFQTTDPTPMGSAATPFVTKFNPTGTGVVYSTYLGGTTLPAGGADIANAIALDPFGNAFITGSVDSTNFPTVNPTQANKAGLLVDAFVSVLNTAGSGLVFSTYFGGSMIDSGKAIAVDPSRNFYIAGQTNSANLPVTTGVFQTTLGGGSDAFVTQYPVVTVPPPPGPPPPPPSPPGPPPPPAPAPGTVAGPGGTSIPGVQVDQFEANNTSDVPTNLGAVVGTQPFTGMSIARTAANRFDQDWYSFTMPTGGVFNVTLPIIVAGGDIHVRVFRLNPNSTLTELGNSTLINSSTQSVSVGVAAGQTLFVWIFGFNSAEGFYNMTVSLT